MNNQVGNNVSGGRRDALVILGAERAAESIEQVCAGCRVQQLASQRVGVVESSQSQLSNLQSLPGVTVITGGDLPPGVTEGLDEGESLFVNAWLSRNKNEPPKQRRGEGLPWDAPGFEPPDPPPDKQQPDDDQKDEERSQ